MNRLSIAIITDIHWGADYFRRLGSKAKSVVIAFAKAVRERKPDITVDMGDRVSNKKDVSVEREGLKYISGVFNRLSRALKMPVCALLGNHDIRQLTRAEAAAASDTSETSYSRDEGGYHLVFWNPGDEHTLNIQPADIEWLRADIAATRKPTVVFSHIPLDLKKADFKVPKSQIDRDGRFYYKQGPEIRTMFEESGKVILCFAGHRHRNQPREINGIHYFQLQSPVQQWPRKKSTRAPGDPLRPKKSPYRVAHRTWTFVELEGDKITVDIKGRGGSIHNLIARPVLMTENDNIPPLPAPAPEPPSL